MNAKLLSSILVIGTLATGTVLNTASAEARGGGYRGRGPVAAPSVVKINNSPITVVSAPVQNIGNASVITGQVVQAVQFAPVQVNVGGGTNSIVAPTTQSITTTIAAPAPKKSWSKPQWKSQWKY